MDPVLEEPELVQLRTLTSLKCQVLVDCWELNAGGRGEAWKFRGREAGLLGGKGMDNLLNLVFSLHRYV